MKEGKYFRIPERPSDIEEIRRLSQQLDEITRPSWLDPADDNLFRFVGTASCAQFHLDMREQYQMELEELETTGLIADPDPRQANAHRLYIPSENEYNIWSIGIYTGVTPWAFWPAGDVNNPVLTREDVTDVIAELVADPFMIHVKRTWFMFFEVLRNRTRN